mgnify:CR=1 FL=1
MSSDLALWCVLAAPIAQALLVALLWRPPGLRDTIHFLFACAGAGWALYLVGAVAAGETARVVLARPLPQVDLAFSAEPLGALIAALILGLGAPHAMHTIGLVRATRERAPARLMALCALATAAAVATALSANLFSFFVAYQALILAVFPLVAHRGDEESRRAAGIFLATLMASSIGLFLPAMVWTYAIAGALDFQPGGVFVGRIDTITANVLLTMFVLGLATTAIPPMHRWLAAATAAPYPALASIYALAILPAGGVGVLKIAAFVFGPALSDAAFAARAMMVLAGVGMCMAALLALSKQDLRERLAYSCMAQSLAVVIGALLALPAGLFAATLQVVALSCAAVTLFMAAGTVAAVTGRANAADYRGLGRVMPVTFAGFALAAASMIGMPPFSGAWAKLWLITASAASGLVWAAALVGLAAVLTFAHLGPLAANALAAKAPSGAIDKPDGASIVLAAPVVVTALATLWLLVLADPLASFLSPIWTPRP